MLIDKASGIGVSYLYWEAKEELSLLHSSMVIRPFSYFHSVVSEPLTPVASRPTTPIANTETFDPAHPSVNPGDSVLLPISKVPSYLDGT